MKNKLFEGDYSEIELRQMLQDNCDFVEDGNYVRNLDEEELAVKKDELAEISIKLAGVQAEKKEAVAVFNEQMKPLKIDLGTAIQAVKSRAEDCNGRLYHFADHESGMMGIYDDRGELVNSRRLKPEEKQGNVLGDFQKRTGTNE